jgi:hypothetical protein
LFPTVYDVIYNIYIIHTRIYRHRLYLLYLYRDNNNNNNNNNNNTHVRIIYTHSSWWTIGQQVSASVRVRVRLSSRVALFSVGPTKGPHIVFTPRRRGRVSLIIACRAYASAIHHAHCTRTLVSGGGVTVTRRRKRGRPVFRFPIFYYYYDT